MISIITPTHDPKYLRETYESLLKQTNQDWEWIIVPNGGIKIIDCLKVLPGMENRLSIHQLPEALEGKGIGAIKWFSFMQGTGDYLLELDHDDLLAPTALEDCVKAFEETGADFVYSNFADFFPDGNWHYWDEKDGWRYRNTLVDDEFYKQFSMAKEGVRTGYFNECLSFPPSAATFGRIYTAPNHLRAWRKDSYHKLGGHNPNYQLCDDHELCIRTYLKGKVHHIEKCLYLYRFHDNTFSKNLGEIARLTNDLYLQNVEALILREAELEGLPCYDLGGAFSCPAGWKSCDLQDADVVCDLNQRWPFADSSVLAFRAFDIFEHLSDKQHVMREASRCLVNGGYLHVQVPDCRHMGGAMDPTHVSNWNPGSFWYYTRAEQAQYIRNTKEKFMEQRLFEFFPTTWHEANDIKYVKAELINIKNGRERIPGALRI